MDEEIEVTEYLKRLATHWKIAAAVFLVVFGIALIYTLFMPKIFEADSRVELLTQDPLVLSGTGQIKVDMETQKEMALSQNVLTPDLSQYSTVDISRLSDSYVLAISVRSQDPNEAVRVANGIADNFIAYNLKVRKDSAQRMAARIIEQEPQARANLTKINEKMVGLSTKSPEYLTLKQELNARQKTYDILVLTLQEQQLIINSQTGTAKVVQRAGGANLVSPNTTLNLFVGAIFGIIAGLMIVFFIGGNRFSTKDFEEELGPVIGTMPHLTKKGMHNYRILDHEPLGKTADQLNLLAQNLPDTHLIAIVSAKQGDGKSTIASNLAIALSHKGKRILLVDANLRDPILTRVYQLKDKEPGLTDVIVENAKLDNVIRIRKTTYENLFILPSGKIREDSLKLLGSPRMKEICNKLRASNFDYVFFDTSALINHEAAAVAAQCDAALYIVTMRSAKTDLIKPKANVIGVVVNDK